jgi:hypothetical protein
MCSACSGRNVIGADYLELWGGHGLDDVYGNVGTAYMCEIEVCPSGRYHNGGAGPASCSACPPGTFQTSSSATAATSMAACVTFTSAGLVASLLPENLRSSAALWVDASGAGNSATVFGLPQVLTTGGLTYVSMASSGQRAVMSNQQSSPTVFSLGVWWRTSTASGRKLVGFDETQGTSSGSYDRHMYVGTDGRLYFGIWTGTHTTALSSSTVVTDGHWHFGTGTFHGPSGVMSLYLDGSLVGQSITNTVSYMGYWHIGGYTLEGWPNGADGSWIGDIGPVTVHSIALSPLQVLVNYEATGSTVQVGDNRCADTHHAPTFAEAFLVRQPLTDRMKLRLPAAENHGGTHVDRTDVMTALKSCRTCVPLLA